MRNRGRSRSVLRAGLLGEFLLVTALAALSWGGLASGPVAVAGLIAGLVVLLATMGIDRHRQTSAPPVATDGGGAGPDVHYARSYCRTLGECAEGDLTRRLETDVDAVALRDVARSINDVLENYETTLGTAEAYAEEVSGSTAQLTTATKTTKETCEGVGEIVQDIVAAFHEQHEQVEEVSAEIHEIYDAIERTSRIQAGLSRKAERMERASDEGTASTRAAHAAMSDVQSQSAELSEMIEALDRKTNEIERVVELINTIADKTTSLALDASLEVVRDDATSEDLGDVANEITSLADDTKEATSDIEAHLEDIQAQTDRVVGEMAAMEATADDGMATAEDALDALSRISENVSETVDGIDEISHETDELTASAEEIAHSADRMARVSDETIGRAERVEYIVEEVTLALGEIYVNTKNLEIETSHLVGVLDWFSTDADPS